MAFSPTRVEGLAPPSLSGAQGGSVGAVRSHLRPQDGVDAPARQQERMAEGARKARNPAAHPTVPRTTSVARSPSARSAAEPAPTWDATAATPFLGLNKTCAKLGIEFWDYLGARLSPRLQGYPRPSPTSPTGGFWRGEAF